MVGHTHENRGSVWRKWDLHIHSPQAFLNNKYKNKGETVDQFVNKIVASDISVVGLTNYFRFDKEELTSIKDKLKAKGIVVFPNIELRIEQRNKDKQAINIHILFSDKTPTVKIERFLVRLKMIDQRYCPDLSTDKDFSSALVGYNVLRDTLKDDTSIKHLEDYLIAACPRGLGGFRPSQGDDGRGNMLATDIDKYSDILFGNSKDTDYFLRTDRYLNAKQKPVMLCSDSHELDEIGTGYSWIKAEPTFEGLKQTLYDPQSRVRIADQEPIKPNNVIDSITFNIPKDATLSVKRSGGTRKKDRFCFAGIKNTYYLSPFFNCFIGGRGSGKSTLLNLMGYQPYSTSSSLDFWKKIELSFGIAEGAFSKKGGTYFEFIQQNEIESFATDEKAFTDAIYLRADILSDKALSRCEEKLKNALGAISSFLSLRRNYKELIYIRKEQLTERETLKAAINFTRSSRYSEISTKITEKSNKRRELEKWRVIIEELRRSNETLTTKLHQLSPLAHKDRHSSARAYIEAFEEVKISSANIDRVLDARKFKNIERTEVGLTEEIGKLENELYELLEKAGLSRENILQIRSAPQRIVTIDGELLLLDAQIKHLQTQIGRYDHALEKLKEAKKEYEKAIKDGLKPLSRKLEDQAETNDKRDIKNIKLKYFFDTEKAWANIAQEFYDTFSVEYKSRERQDSLKSYIVFEKEIFLGTHKGIREHLDRVPGDRGYLEFLRSVFKEEVNYQAFVAIRDRHLNDAVGYKRIQVLYDGKDIEQASFGQKCTAVLVILLLFGNYPLVIDEPEAHLDSSLIADYLVPLIKDNKNTRQIIFATHNANFVINGDAEKIFILKNETGVTKITETTIENLKYRNELLKLEGGKEAFIRRGEKLHIQP